MANIFFFSASYFGRYFLWFSIQRYPFVPIDPSFASTSHKHNCCNSLFSSDPGTRWSILLETLQSKVDYRKQFSLRQKGVPKKRPPKIIARHFSKSKRTDCFHLWCQTTSSWRVNCKCVIKLIVWFGVSFALWSAIWAQILITHPRHY